MPVGLSLLMADLTAVMIVALSADTYITVITSVVVPLLTTFGVLFWRATRTFVRERREAPIRERTVAMGEMESLTRMYSESLKQARLDEQECRAELDTCRGWQREHIQICPLFGGGARGS